MKVKQGLVSKIIKALESSKSIMLFWKMVGLVIPTLDERLSAEEWVIGWVLGQTHSNVITIQTKVRNGRVGSESSCNVGCIFRVDRNRTRFLIRLKMITQSTLTLKVTRSAGHGTISSEFNFNQTHQLISTLI